MLVFAWILFIISALSTLVFLWEWFGAGQGFIGLIHSVCLTAYLVCYLFIVKFGLIANWISLGVFGVLCLINLLTRKPFGTALTLAGVIFVLLVIF